MNTLLRAIAVLAIASPAFGQYPAAYSPFGYPPVLPTPVIVMAPPQHYINPFGYRPTHLHGMMNPYYAQQYAVDLSYAMNYERKRQFMEQYERQRQMILAMAPDWRAQKIEERTANQQRALNKHQGNQPAVANPDMNNPAKDLRNF